MTGIKHVLILSQRSGDGLIVLDTSHVSAFDTFVAVPELRKVDANEFVEVDRVSFDSAKLPPLGLFAPTMSRLMEAAPALLDYDAVCIDNQTILDGGTCFIADMILYRKTT
jgi:hypothetical protein